MRTALTFSGPQPRVIDDKLVPRLERMYDMKRALLLTLLASATSANAELKIEFKGETVYDAQESCPDTHVALVHNRFLVSGSRDLSSLHVIFVAANEPNKGVPHIEPVRTFNGRGEVVHTYCAGLGDKNVYKVRFYDSATAEQSNTITFNHPEIKKDELKEGPEELSRVSGR